MDAIWNWIFGNDPAKPVPETARLAADYPTAELWVLAAIFAGLGVLGYIALVYRRESRTLGGAWAGLLGALRVLAVTVAVLVLLRPRWEWEVPQKPDPLDELEPEPPTVIFLIDESRSMDEDDSAKLSDGMAAELAKSLGYAEPGRIKGRTRLQLVKTAFGEQAETLAKRLRGGLKEKPVLDGSPVNKVRIYAFGSEPRELHHDDYRRRLRPKAGETEVPPPAEPPAVSLQKLTEALKLAGVGVPPRKDVAPRPGVPAPTVPVTEAPDERDREAFEARREETNIGGSLLAVTSDRNVKVTAVVLVSDGRNTGLALPPDGTLKRMGVPVHVVGVGSTVREPNLRLADFRSDAAVRKGEPFRMRALVGRDGLDAVNAEFELFRRRIDYDADGVRKPASPSDWQIVQGPPPSALGGEAMEQIDFTQVGTEAGEFEYRLVAKVPGLDEKNLKDNEKTVEVRVLDDRIKVLLVSGDGGWEYRALKNYLLRSQAIRVSILQQTSSTDFDQESSPRDDRDRELPEMRINTLPRNPEKLAKYDAVVLMDPVWTRTPVEDERSLDRRIDPRWCEMLHRMVTDRGMGLVYVAGIKNTADIFKEADSAAPDKLLFKPLADLLPVLPNTQAMVLMRGVERAFPIVVTERDGRYHPILRFEARDRMEDELAANTARWEQLPRIFWSMPVREVKPSAVILAEHANPRVKFGERNLPIIAEQRSGIGRSVWFGFDSSWRFRFLGDTVFSEYWMRTLRYVVEGRKLGGRKRADIITDGREVYRTGEPVDFRVELRTTRFDPLVWEAPPKGLGGTVEERPLGPYLILTRRAADSGDTRVNPGMGGEAPAMPGMGADADTVALKLEPVPGQPGAYRSSFLPKRAGRWETTLKWEGPPPENPEMELPADYERRNVLVTQPSRELREVRADFTELKRAAAATGGAFLMAGQVDQLAAKIQDLPVPRPKVALQTKEPKRETRSVWDMPAWLILFAVFLFAEWSIRKWKNLA